MTGRALHTITSKPVRALRVRNSQPRNPLIGGFGANPTQTHLLPALRPTSHRRQPITVAMIIGDGRVVLPDAGR
jgi:hypothetical protein